MLPPRPHVFPLFLGQRVVKWTTGWSRIWKDLASLVIQHPKFKRWSTTGDIIEIGAFPDYLVKTPTSRLFHRNWRFICLGSPVSVQDGPSQSFVDPSFPAHSSVPMAFLCVLFRQAFVFRYYYLPIQPIPNIVFVLFFIQQSSFRQDSVGFCLFLSNVVLGRRRHVITCQRRPSLI